MLLQKLHPKNLIHIIQHDMCTLITWSPPRHHLENVFIQVRIPPAPQPAETSGGQVERSNTEENSDEADAAAASTASSIPFIGFLSKT